MSTRWTMTAAGLIGAAILCAGAEAASTEVRIALRWNSARLPASMASVMEAEASAIWAALDVTLVWETCVSVCDGLLIVVTDDAVAIPTPAGAGLGEIFFVDGRPGSRLRVSAAAALDAIEEAARRGLAFTNAPNVTRTDAAARLLGRAAAHELGHYLLASRAHAARGLMRPVFNAEEGMARRPNQYDLDRRQREQLRMVLEGFAQPAATPINAGRK
jgi:hypothetical protein